MLNHSKRSLIITTILSLSVLTSSNASALDLIPSKIRATHLTLEGEDALLKACDEALNACIEADKSKTEVIDAQHLVIGEQSARIEALESEQRSILKSPILWFVIGVAAASITIGVASK